MRDDTNLHKEIDLIQNCIDRMAKNSFMLKGWSISLVAAVFALTTDRLSPVFLFCSVFIPLCCFWYLDAFFLRTERMYRKMYEYVLRERKSGNMEYQYDLNPHRFKENVENHSCTMLSKTLAVFYGIPVLIVFIMFLSTLCQK